MMRWSVNYRYCQFCGRLFTAPLKANGKKFCSKQHMWRQWRAVDMLRRTTPE